MVAIDDVQGVYICLKLGVNFPEAYLGTVCRGKARDKFCCL